MFGAQKLYSVKIPMVLLSQAYWLLTIVAVVLSYLKFFEANAELVKRVSEDSSHFKMRSFLLLG
jgi:hypothetical protein